MKSITAKEALILSKSSLHAFIDVRSESEFAQGHIPGFVNFPLLNDEERHQVGIAYKTFGQEAAVKLGYDLVNPNAEKRTADWANQIQLSPVKTGIITCWRGGLRSKLVTEAVLKEDQVAMQCIGGYKAMRRELMETLANPPILTALSGMTGSGKTDLIQSLETEHKVDLEALAQHRGSSFGHYAEIRQPSTATFENRLALAVREKLGPILIEDESRGIGQVTIPNIFLRKLRAAPIVVLRVPRNLRAVRIFKEYIETPFNRGIELRSLHDDALKGLSSIRKRLGGVLTDLLLDMTKKAFESKDIDIDQHIEWISLLLAEYYDKLYQHSTTSWQRPVLFEGDYDACNQWILNHLNSQNQ
jgi:tRNA 2-selenouridine synthase